MFAADVLRLYLNGVCRVGAPDDGCIVTSRYVCTRAGQVVCGGFRYSGCPVVCGGLPVLRLSAVPVVRSCVPVIRYSGLPVVCVFLFLQFTIKADDCTWLSIDVC